MNGTATLFLVFVAAVATGVEGIVAWRLPARAAVGIGIALSLWLTWVGVLGWSGAIADATRRPPAILAIAVPVFVFVLFAVVRSRSAGRLVLTVPLPILIGAQAYRVAVELFLHRLWIEGLSPRMLTYDGANVDLWIGASAPVAAWLSTRGRGGERVALAWNVVGLFSIANVVVRSVLTSPGPLRLLDTDVVNRVAGSFPYTFIPGFLAPLAITLHVLALRSIAARGAAARPSKGFPA